MAKKKRASLQDIIRKRQQEEFVGRSEQIALFRRNFSLDLDDEKRRFIFNVYGQGGVGKTTLLKQLRQIARVSGAITAVSDETEQDVIATLIRFATQFEQQGYPLQQFIDKHRQYSQQYQRLKAQYRTKRSKLSSDARNALYASIAEYFHQEELRSLCFDIGVDIEELPASTKTAKARELVAYCERHGRIADLIALCQKKRPHINWQSELDNELLGEAMLDEDWPQFVKRQLDDIESVSFILDPVPVLTTHFLQEITGVALKHDLVFMCDGYEQTAIFLDSWWRNVLASNRYGEVPANIVIVFAGRQPLNADSWSFYTSLIVRLPLEPFTEEEVRHYLAEKQITDEKVVEIILRVSGRLPLLVAMLATNQPKNVSALEEPSELAVARFLKWIQDRKQRQLALDAALPRRLNAEILSIVAENGSNHYPWLAGLPFVQERVDGWAYYHEVVRSQMLRQKRRESSNGWKNVHQALGEFFLQSANAQLQESVPEWARWLNSHWQTEILEYLYHQLSATKIETTWALQGFLKALQADRAFARRWAETVQAAQNDSGDYALEVEDTLGDKLVAAVRAFDESRYEDVLPMFQEMLHRSDLDKTDLAIALTWLGRTYRRLERFGDSLVALDEAVNLAPDNFWIHHHRGWTCLRMGNFNGALTCFDKVLEMLPYHQAALNIRGWLRQEVGDFEGALDDLRKVLMKDSEKASAYYYRGLTYFKLGQLDDALEAFNQAIRFEPRYLEAFVNRGEVYLLLKQFNKALSDFNRAIVLNGNHPLIYALRGRLFHIMNKNTEAQKDFDRARQLAKKEHLLPSWFARTEYDNEQVIMRQIQADEQSIQEQVPERLQGLPSSIFDNPDYFSSDLAFVDFSEMRTKENFSDCDSSPEQQRL